MTAAGKPRVVLRADASLEIGTGHVMRCLALAEELRRRGADCEFICRELPGHLAPEIERRGFHVHLLVEGYRGRAEESRTDVAAPSGYGGWLGGVSQTDDADQVLATLAGRAVDWLVIDHYALDKRWEAQLRSAARKIMVIDDLAERPHECDLLLDQNAARNPGDYKALVPIACEVLCGPEFALLRPEFAELRSRSLARRASAVVERILVSLGGVDKDNATGTVLDALNESSLSGETRIVVMMGRTAPWIEEVRRQAMALPFSVEVEVASTNVADLMAASDFAVGAAGSTSWERCCMGLPCAMVLMADNQEGAYAELQQAGAAVGVGRPEEIRVMLPKIINNILERPVLVRQMAVAAARICDGRGTEHVVDCMNRILPT
jgi:UDP-2,4-diacetamido-2,4,6-trideoxy-beta-L-altropyranose hydrolase